ncbi:MAG: sodium:solute symporter [Flavobacterium sp. BFFFF1]|uniref:sodium:solute symporter n=1 Tax=unclassified Flavobacterium TaxID=196869 RepID=UPI000BC3EE2E|nr:MULTISPECIES: sodium:solute symporter [unclassified Flavobacterium]OYU81186.1 MAG: sodium:solute symporter [Flavobacterium sp. BFFFF1]
MQPIDWIVLVATICFIVFYGVWKTTGSKNVEEYILGNHETPWYTVGISVMATQASAITFLSTPGQAYEDGMGFVQFYFGLPLAMVIICYTFIPIYHKLKVYTAYEFLEKRFDQKTRSLAAILFLVQRGLGTGITIYAPAIILSTILGWDLNKMIIAIGALVIIYTFSGGTKAVNVTHKQQMFIILCGMGVAFYLILHSLPEDITFGKALKIAGASGKMNILDFTLDTKSRYTFWSGITGGLFLMLSYFGTDQSQVQRYLSGKSIRESQLGLIMNGILKVPMQFFILLTGVMVFVFFQFEPIPLNFNPNSKNIIAHSSYANDYKILEKQLAAIDNEKRTAALRLATDSDNKSLAETVKTLTLQEKEVREKGKELISKASQKDKTSDADYVFIHFIVHYLPRGFIGLLLAVILCAAMSSTASGLNALASTTVMDIYRRNLKTEKPEIHFVNAGKLFTILWGVVAIAFACLGSLFTNLIQLVNIVGSVFYGTVLGIFLVGFYIKYVKSAAIFWSAVISQCIVFYIYYEAIHIYAPGKEKLGYLWLNFIGAALTILFSIIIQLFSTKKRDPINA